MTKIKKILCIFIAIFGILTASSCATARLEKRLPRELKNFYSYWSIYMDDQLPNGQKERDYFLRLPMQYQLEYAKIFWKLRWEGCEEEAISRLQCCVMMRAFQKEPRKWDCDRARLFRLCGPPAFITTYDTRSGDVVGDEDMFDVPSAIIQEWTYFPERGFNPISFYFTYSQVGEWKADFNMFRPNTDSQLEFRAWNVEWWGALVDNWYLWEEACQKLR